ncbi:hypothetical protein evm_010698 [Chilo suppressalis]|nr:hypothetical protein evm_010698 [Chilo suppressalis]
MYKLFIFAAILAYAAAAPGIIGGYAAPLAAPWGHGVVGAPLYGAPVVKTAVPVATSYANTVRIASPAVGVAPAPYAVAPAPYAVAHAPVIASPFAHAW